MRYAVGVVHRECIGGHGFAFDLVGTGCLQCHQVGTQMVGAIHGRLLTAWSAAGIIGPVLINYLREFQLAHGVSRALAYDITMYILVGLLVLGLICNWLVKPVDEKHYMTDAELAAELDKARESQVAVPVAGGAAVATTPLTLVGAWLFVGVPILWGAWITLGKALVLFR